MRGAQAPFSLAKSYEDWWAYRESIQGTFVPGPAFWGLVNAAWNLCTIGKRQSPINVNTSQVVFDPFLPPLRLSLEGKTISGTLSNTGRHVSFLPERRWAVNVSGGPLLYTHRLEEVRLHFGSEDGAGSEHRINKKAFSAEVQLIHYNQELYSNMSEAAGNPNGLAIISLLVNVANNSNPFLKRVLNRETTTRISFKGDITVLHDLPLKQLFPDTFAFVTYQGSTTTPPCYETVTWIVIDQPLNITSMQLMIPSHQEHRAKSHMKRLGQTHVTSDFEEDLMFFIKEMEGAKVEFLIPHWQSLCHSSWVELCGEGRTGSI